MVRGINISPFRWPVGKSSSAGWETDVAGETYQPLCKTRLQNELDAALRMGFTHVRVDSEFAGFAPHPNPLVTPYDYYRAIWPVTHMVALSGMTLEWVWYGDPQQNAAWKALNGGNAWTATRPPSGLWSSATAAIQAGWDFTRAAWAEAGRSLTDGSLKMQGWNEPDQVGGPAASAGQIWSFTNGGAYPSFHDVYQGIFGALDLHGHPFIAPSISTEQDGGVYDHPTFCDRVLADIASLDPAQYPVYLKPTDWATNQYNKLMNFSDRGLWQWRRVVKAHGRAVRDSFRAVSAFGINTKKLSICEGPGSNHAVRGSYPENWSDYGTYIVAWQEAMQDLGCYDRVTAFTMSDDETATYSYGIHYFASDTWRSMVGTLEVAAGNDISTSPPSGSWHTGPAEFAPDGAIHAGGGGGGPAPQTFLPVSNTFLQLGHAIPYDGGNLGTFDIASGSPRVILLRFDLTSQLGKTATSASLSMTEQNLNSSGLSVRRCTRSNWIEGEATWVNYATGSAWSVAGGDVSTPNVLAYAYAGSGAINITGLDALVQDALDNRAGILSLRIEGDAGGGLLSILDRSAGLSGPLLRFTA